MRRPLLLFCLLAASLLCSASASTGTVNDKIDASKASRITPVKVAGSQDLIIIIHNDGKGSKGERKASGGGKSSSDASYAPPAPYEAEDTASSTKDDSSEDTVSVPRQFLIDSLDVLEKVSAGKLPVAGKGSTSYGASKKKSKQTAYGADDADDADDAGGDATDSSDDEDTESSTEDTQSYSSSSKKTSSKSKKQPADKDSYYKAGEDSDEEAEGYSGSSTKKKGGKKKYQQKGDAAGDEESDDEGTSSSNKYDKKVEEDSYQPKKSKEGYNSQQHPDSYEKEGDDSDNEAQYGSKQKKDSGDEYSSSSKYGSRRDSDSSDRDYERKSDDAAYGGGGSGSKEKEAYGRDASSYGGKEARQRDADGYYKGGSKDRDEDHSDDDEGGYSSSKDGGDGYSKQEIDARHQYDADHGDNDHDSYGSSKDAYSGGGQEDDYKSSSGYGGDARLPEYGSLGLEEPGPYYNEPKLHTTCMQVIDVLPAQVGDPVGSVRYSFRCCTERDDPKFCLKEDSPYYGSYSEGSHHNWLSLTYDALRNSEPAGTCFFTPTSTPCPYYEDGVCQTYLGTCTLTRLGADCGCPSRTGASLEVTAYAHNVAGLSCNALYSLSDTLPIRAMHPAESQSLWQRRGSGSLESTSQPGGRPGQRALLQTVLNDAPFMGVATVMQGLVSGINDLSGTMTFVPKFGVPAKVQPRIALGSRMPVRPRQVSIRDAVRKNLETDASMDAQVAAASVNAAETSSAPDTATVAVASIGAMPSAADSFSVAAAAASTSGHGGSAKTQTKTVKAKTQQASVAVPTRSIVHTRQLPTLFEEAPSAPLPLPDLPFFMGGRMIITWTTS